MSSTAIDKPAFVAKEKPDCNSLSAKMTVDRNPHFLKEEFINFEISFFFNTLLSSSNGNPGGRIFDKIARPTVVPYLLKVTSSGCSSLPGIDSGILTKIFVPTSSLLLQ